MGSRKMMGRLWGVRTVKGWAEGDMSGLDRWGRRWDGGRRRWENVWTWEGGDVELARGFDWRTFVRAVGDVGSLKTVKK